MWSSMKTWILKHSAVMPIYIAEAVAITSILIVLFLIYRTLCKISVCDTSSFMRRLVQGVSESIIEYSIEDLKHATDNFAEIHYIGSGNFGPVYIGVLEDTIIAVKKLAGSFHPKFLDEVTYLSTIRHCNVVNLVGYCCENEQQMLVYEYLCNGNMRNNLSGSIDLKFKKRISIAIGAARGLLHLHSLTPPLTHKRFKAANVLLDANFNAKVADAGLSRLLETRNEEEANDDHDLEVGFVNQETFNESSDVYSFGLFLLELITGEDTEGLTSPDELNEWISSRVLANTLVDQRMNGTFTNEAMNSVKEIMEKCLSFPATNRPKMDEVVTELEKIYLNGFTCEECYTRLILGSELFTINE